MTGTYVANVIGENLIEADLPVERPNPAPVVVGDDGVVVLYGEVETGVTATVNADDADDAERRLIATFGDTATIDDLREAAEIGHHRRKRYLDFRFDVTDLSDEETGELALEVSAMAERSDGHPSVPQPESETVEVAEPRTVLVHLNVEVPADDARGPDKIADAILGALHVGIEGGYDYVGDLKVAVPLAEEL